MNNTGKTDLHCHILPGIDDGCATPEETQALLLEEKKQGITQIVFTPHFYPNRITLEDFLCRRDSIYKDVKKAAEKLNIDCSIGAEVHMNPLLMDLDLAKLCFEGSNYLLLEWPFSAYPLWGDDIIEKLHNEDIRPIFAHIERFEYFYLHPENLEKYIDLGTVCQMNASNIVKEESRKRSLKLIKSGYIQIIASDTHNMRKRPPLLKNACEIIEDKISEDALQTLLRNADGIFNDLSVPKPNIKKKSGLFGLFK